MNKKCQVFTPENYLNEKLNSRCVLSQGSVK